MRRILFILFAIFIVVPLLELTLLLILASYTHWWVSLALVVVTGVVGSLLAHSQGWRTLNKIRSQLGSGRLPADSLMDGAMILAAGCLLLTPGVITDAFGISLLLPPVRRIYKNLLIGWFSSRFHVRTMLSHFGSGSTDEDDDEYRSPSSTSSKGKADVVDSYVVHEERRP